jgi:hypothetical protein
LYHFARNVEAAAAIVQVESDPIEERRERLRALRAAAELALADQGDEEPEKQLPDTTATEQQKEDSYSSVFVSLFFSVSPCGNDAFVSFGFCDKSSTTIGVVTTQEGMFCHLRE